MKKILIKICGITNVDDALQAIHCGADLLGFIFVSTSPRSITVAQAQAVARAIRAETQQSVQLVGVFQDHALVDVIHHTQTIGLDRAQLHGDESPAFCKALPVPVFKTVLLDSALEEKNLLQRIETFQPGEISNIDALLLDLPKHAPEKNFAAFPISTSLQEKLRSTRHFVAGRLNPENVGDVILKRNPDGIDVASGIESAPGRKDLVKMAAFCQNVRAAEQGTKTLGDSFPCNR